MGALAATKTTAPPKSTPQPTRAPAPAPQQRQAASGFDTAKPRGARNYLTPIDDHTSAIYVVKVNRTELIFAHESKAPQKCESSIIEVEVVESNNPKCPPGYCAGVVYTNRHYEEIYWGNVKGFLCGLLNMEPEAVSTKIWHAAFGRRPDGISDAEWKETEKEIGEMVIGALVNVNVSYKLRDGKKPITQEIWTPNETQHPAAS